jgi:hypothetical protein
MAHGTSKTILAVDYEARLAGSLSHAIFGYFSNIDGAYPAFNCPFSLEVDAPALPPE